MIKVPAIKKARAPRTQSKSSAAKLICGADITAMRKEIGWSTVQVGNAVNRSEGWVRKIERDEIPCPVKLSEWLSKVLEAFRALPPPTL